MCRLQTVLAIVALLGGALGQLQAASIATVNSDTPQNLDISWTWDPEELVILSLTGTEVLSWLFQFDMELVSDDPMIDFRAIVNTGHAVDVHAGAGESGGGAAAQFENGFGASQFGPIIDETMIVPHGSHEDVYRFTFERGIVPADNLFQLTGSHVPEPSTLTLASLCLLGLLAYGWQRRRRA